MQNNKKEYLSAYLLQQAKIDRLNKMTFLNPDLKAKYEQEIQNAKTIRNEIENKIESVDNGILSEVLFQKYILGRTLEEVSLAINYSKRQTERFHIAALEKFKM